MGIESIDDLLENVQLRKRTVLDISGEGPNRKVEFTLKEELPPEPREPRKAESPKRAHEFHDAASLGDYLKKYGGEDTVVFADVAKEEISAVLNEKADRGFELLTMKPVVHPLWAPWAAIVGKRLPVLEFAKHVLEHRRSIQKPDGRLVAHDFSQVRAAIKTEVFEGRGPTALNGIVVHTEIKGNTQQKTVELPDEITVRVPIYVGTDAQDVVLDLCVEAQPGTSTVTVLASAGFVAQARVNAFEDMIETLEAAVQEKGAVLTLGRPQHKAWRYLDPVPGREEA